MNIDRWRKLVQVREKLEKIFFGAGGKPANLKKAILHGKGNKDHAVNGFDGFGMINSNYHHNHPLHPLNRIHKKMPLRQLLGDTVFFDENPVGTLGELGEPISMAMIAAASGVIAAIASAIKKVGDIFGGKGKGAQDFDEATNDQAESEIPSGENSTDTPSADADSSGDTATKAIKAPSGGGGEEDGGNTDSGGGTQDADSGDPDGTNGTKSKALTKTAPDDSDKGGGDDAKEGFWDKNKKWVVPVGVGVAGIGLLALVAHSMKPAATASRAMHGLPRKKAQPKKKATTSKKKKTTPKKSGSHKKRVTPKALL